MAVIGNKVLLNSFEEDEFADVSEDLFKCEDGSPFSFFVVPCVERNRIKKMIELGGGKVERKSGPYTITLVPPAMAAYLGDEVFGYDFIYCCCVHNALQDLKAYRIGFHSKKFEDYDPMDVLQQRLKWDDVTLLLKTSEDEGKDVDVENSSTSSTPEKESVLPTNSGKQPQTLFFTSGTVEKTDPLKVEFMLEKLKTTAKRLSPEPEALFIEEEMSVESVEKSPLRYTHKEHKNQLSEPTVQVLSDSLDGSGVPTISAKRNRVKVHLVPKKIKTPKLRRDYQENERRLIVQYIHEREAYNQVKGTRIWLDLESTGIVEGRTWQSMKEHYIKKIIPNIRSYKLPPAVVVKFKQPFKK